MAAGVARLPGEALLPTSFDFIVFMLAPHGATLTGFGPFGGRSSSTAPATSTAPSIG
jgi:hypothetical protein